MIDLTVSLMHIAHISTNSLLLDYSIGFVCIAYVTAKLTTFDDWAPCFRNFKFHFKLNIVAAVITFPPFWRIENWEFMCCYILPTFRFNRKPSSRVGEMFIKINSIKLHSQEPTCRIGFSHRCIREGVSPSDNPLPSKIIHHAIQNWDYPIRR